MHVPKGNNKISGYFVDTCHGNGMPTVSCQKVKVRSGLTFLLLLFFIFPYGGKREIDKGCDRWVISPLAARFPALFFAGCSC